MLPTAHLPLSTPAVGWQEDVFIDKPNAANDRLTVGLVFGRRHRGESVKTGQEQGVKVESPMVAHLFIILPLAAPVMHKTEATSAECEELNFGVGSRWVKAGGVLPLPPSTDAPP